MAKLRPILPELRDHAEAIGYLCIHWAMLELELDGWLANLIPLGEPPINDIVATEIDFRAKIQILKNLAYVKAPNDAWFGTMRATLDDIDNRLRPERNRMVHDLWLAQGHPNGPAKMQRNAKLVKEPRRLKLVTNPMAPMPVDEIINLLSEVIAAQACLSKLKSEFMTAQKRP